ncbi:MAG: lysostaphin resistance A-like protein [Candidatus Acidiferrales bacterium]
MTDELRPADWPQPNSAPAAPPPGGDAGATIRSIFLGPSGIRAGWRLLIFIAVFAAAAMGIQFVLVHIPYFKQLHDAARSQTMSARSLIFGEGFTVLALFIAAFVMALIEKRTFADYGLPGREAFGKRFLSGLPYGFAMLSLLLGAIGALHGFSLGGMDISAAQAWKYGIAYAFGFLLVGFFEEFSFRGYMQATLASGMGFWPAAILLSIAFGGIHLGNPGEAKFGALMAGSFGLLAAFSLKRTGSIWFAIGMHASWDWAETFF